MHNPGDYKRQSGAIGSASRMASRTGVSRSSSWWSVRRALVRFIVDCRGPAGGEVQAGSASSWMRTSTGSSTSRRHRLHSSASAVRRSTGPAAVGSLHESRTRPSIGWARRRSSARSIVDARDRVGCDRRPDHRRAAGDVPGEQPVVRPARVTASRWTARPPCPPRSPAPPSSPSSISSVPSDERRSSRRSMPFLMLWSVLTTSPSRPTRTPTAYSSAPRRISSARDRRRRRSRGSPRRPPGSGRARRSGRQPAPGPARRSALPPPAPSR